MVAKSVDESVSVLDLESGLSPLQQEARDKAWPFTLRDGTKIVIKPFSKWSLRAHDAFNQSRYSDWAADALEDITHITAFLNQPGDDVGRIVTFLIKESGVNRGEERSSSGSSKTTKKKSS